MSYHQMFQAALTELSTEYDLSPELSESLRKDEDLKEKAHFINRSLDLRQKNILDAFKKNFQYHLNDINSGSEHSCGFIVRCYGNGYRDFCNMPEENHDLYVKKGNNINHVYQKKNINNVIDSKYQEGILTIVNFIGELKVTLIVQLLMHHLTENTIEIKVDYSNSTELRKYDTLMLDDPNYFRLNYLVDNQVIYYNKGQVKVDKP